ncbi:MAG TPA: ATP-binding cassette domain-containing protein [Gemmatimonadales bacterium]
MTAPALELRDIHKRFGRTVALQGASLAVRPGEIHALLGENGAGKTTLMRIAGGLVRPDRGEVLVHGVARRLRSARDARRAGIGMVHQHPTAIASLSVGENIALAAGWPVRPGEIRARIAQLGEDTGLPVDPEAALGGLPIALKQRVEILKALAAGASILLLDEPTAVLAPPEARDLLRVLADFAARGNAVVMVTHKLPEALSSAQTVTVLRHGVVTRSGSSDSETAESLAVAMLGSSTPRTAPVRNRNIHDEGVPRIRVQALDVGKEGGKEAAVREAALEVRAGEIVGIAAVEGNGQRELLRAVAGRIEPLRGSVSVERPLAFIPEDRTTEALIPEFTLAENVVLGLGRAAPGVRGGRIDWQETAAGTARMMADLDVVAEGPGAAAETLSGGNQQRLVLARALAAGPRVIVAENPARGLDVAAAAEIFARLRVAADAGAAILFHSTDLDELLAHSDRVLVMTDGAVREADPGDQELIGRMMVGAA